MLPACLTSYCAYSTPMWFERQLMRTVKMGSQSASLTLPVHMDTLQDPEPYKKYISESMSCNYLWNEFRIWMAWCRFIEKMRWAHGSKSLHTRLKGIIEDPEIQKNLKLWSKTIKNKHIMCASWNCGGNLPNMFLPNHNICHLPSPILSSCTWWNSTPNLQGLLFANLSFWCVWFMHLVGALFWSEWKWEWSWAVGLCLIWYELILNHMSPFQTKCC